MEILFIAGGSIGDAIISTGILGKLMDEYPEATFTVAVGPAAASLFKASERIRQVIPMVKQPWHKHWLSLWQQTVATKWDLVVDLRSSIIAYLLHTRHYRIFKKGDPSLSKAEQLAKLLDFSPPPPPRLWSTEEARESARALLPRDKKIVVVAPKTNSVFKDWPLDRFVELIRRLQSPELIFAIMASAAQQKSLQPLFRTLPADQVVDLSGKTDLVTAYAVLEMSRLFIGNDSGLLHMAAAAGIPIVGIYGPSNDKTYAPRAANIKLLTAHDFKPGEEEKREAGWVEKITIDQVEAAAREIGLL